MKRKDPERKDADRLSKLQSKYEMVLKLIGQATSMSSLKRALKAIEDDGVKMEPRKINPGDDPEDDEAA